mgnify:CR=1 FL=1
MIIIFQFFNFFRKKETTASSSNLLRTSNEQKTFNNLKQRKIKLTIEEYEELKNLKVETLEKLRDYDLFSDIPSNRDILGDFVDKLLEPSLYMYKNK